VADDLVTEFAAVKGKLVASGAWTPDSLAAEYYGLGTFLGLGRSVLSS
jgi:hypothetical protein